MYDFPQSFWDAVNLKLAFAITRLLQGGFLESNIKRFMSFRSNRVVKNVAALLIGKASTYLLPLASIPFLLHTLGASSYGTLAFAQGITAFFSLAVGFGFDMNVTKEVAESRQDTAYIARLTASVVFVKLVFATAGFALLVALVSFVPEMGRASSVFIVGYLNVLGSVFFPRWAFQGLEVMQPMAIIDVVTRAMGVGLLFVFVRDSSDVTLAMFLLSSGSIVAAVASTFYVVFRLRIPFAVPDLKLALRQTRDSWVFFLAAAGGTLFNQGNVVILGFMLSPAAVGIYAAAEKVVKAAAMLNAPITQAVYPHAMRLATEDRKSFVSYIRRMLWLQPSLLAGPSLILLLGAPWIARVLLGIDDGRAASVLMIMALMPLSAAFADVLGNIAMIGFGFKRQFTRLFLIAGVINVVMLLVLVPWMGVIGAAVSVIVTEIILALMRWRFVANRNLLVANRVNEFAAS